MRLIDADAIDRNTFVKAVGENGGFISFGDCLEMLKNQPTAYNVDAVIKEIREYAECDDECANEYNLGYGCTFCKFNTVINFIRKGGVNE